MDARALLETASEAYRGLKSLQAKALAAAENREDGFQHSEQAVTFAYVAPDQARLDQGRHGITAVANGREIHHYFHGPRRYSRGSYAEPRQLPGRFNPEFPLSSNASFLFDRIHERVVDAAVLSTGMLALDGTEVPCDVVSVTYEPPPAKFLAVSPLVVWLDARTRLVLRLEGEMTLQTPTHAARTTKQILTLTHLAADQPVDAATFEFTPPADAEEMPRGQGRLGGSFGFAQTAGGDRRLSHQGSHRWEGETLVEHSQWTLRGIEIVFERRFTLSEDGKEVRIAERILGPKEPIERTVAVPVA